MKLLILNQHQSCHLTNLLTMRISKQPGAKGNGCGNFLNLSPDNPQWIETMISTD